MIQPTAAAFGLFGREESLRVLYDVLEAGGSAVATGDPGVGKSSLLKVADHFAQRQGRRVLSVTPTQFDKGLPFAGLAELISQCPEGVDRSLPEPQRRGLAVALQRVEPDGSEVDALAVPLAVRGLLTHLCESEAVVLIIDDLQWLDQASVGSLAFALRHMSVERHRLSVLVGTRPTGADSDLIRNLPEPRREFTLEPLEDWAIGQLLRKRLGPRWTSPMSVGVARASRGNPFVALMIAKAMQSGTPTWGGTALPGREPLFPVPSNLAELLHERLEQLSRPARETLLLVSVAGRLSLAQLQGIVQEIQLRSALEAAADADLALVGAESLVTFTHPLLASAIYDAASPAERRRAHRLLADKLDDPVERARHRSRSITVPDEMIAGELNRAAEISRDRGAQQLAGELWEAAAAATPAGLHSDITFGRWLRAVDSYMAAGDDAAAQAALDKGSSLATVAEQKAQALVRRIRLVDHYSGVHALAEEAVRLAPEGSEIRAEILHILATCHRMQCDGAAALQLAQLAVTEAAAVGRTDVQLAALNNRLAIEWHWAKGQPHLTVREIAELVESSGLDATSKDAVWTKGFFSVWNDETVELAVRDGITAAVNAGRYRDLSWLYICMILFLIRASRVPDAQAALEESDRLGAWAGSSLQEDMARTMVKEYAGELNEARELAHSAVERSRASGSTYWLAGFMAQVGFIETSAGNWQTALEVTRALAEIFASAELIDLEQLLWAVDYADAALQVGELEDVEAAISVLRRQGAAGRPEATVAADRCAAMLSAVRGDIDNAVTELVRIVGQLGSECPFEAARSRLALGQVYRRAGQKMMADEALTAAAHAFEELGIPLWAERARHDAVRVGRYPATTTLTETERRVAELVGAGRSNQETAAALFISVKTVESNLTRIYRKLSVRSRTELTNRLNDLDSAARHD